MAPPVPERPPLVNADGQTVIWFTEFLGHRRKVMMSVEHLLGMLESHRTVLAAKVAAVERADARMQVTLEVETARDLAAWLSRAESAIRELAAD